MKKSHEDYEYWAWEELFLAWSMIYMTQESIYLVKKKKIEEKPKYSETDVAPIYSILSRFHSFISKWVLYFLSQLKHNEMRCQGTPEKRCFCIVSTGCFPASRWGFLCMFHQGPAIAQKEWAWQERQKVTAECSLLYLKRSLGLGTGKESGQWTLTQVLLKHRNHLRIKW